MASEKAKEQITRKHAELLVKFLKASKAQKKEFIERYLKEKEKEKMPTLVKAFMLAMGVPPYRNLDEATKLINVEERGRLLEMIVDYYPHRTIEAYLLKVEGMLRTLQWIKDGGRKPWEHLLPFYTSRDLESGEGPASAA